jgi:uncharacterized membrane protein YjdF
VKSLDNFIVKRFQNHSKKPFDMAAYFFTGFMVMLVAGFCYSFYDGSTNLGDFILLYSVYVGFNMVKTVESFSKITQLKREQFQQSKVFDRLFYLFFVFLYTIFLCIIWSKMHQHKLSLLLYDLAFWFYLIGANFMACRNPKTIDEIAR